MAAMPPQGSITLMPLLPEVKAHVIVESVMQFLVFAVVALRFYSRAFLGAGIGWDDIIIVFAALLSAVVYGLMIAIQVAGTGYEQTEAAINIPTILLLTFVTVPTYLTTLLCCKLSMLAFYLRVFQKQSLRIYVFVTMGICVAWFVSHFLANVFICSPVEAQWKIELVMSGQGSCGNQIPIFQSMIITNMLTDLIIMVLPIKTIMGLQMRLPEKLGLLASFMLLGAVLIVGAVRVNFVSTVDMRANLTKSMPLSLLTTTLEPNFAILCVSIPMLRPIYTKYRARYGSRGATKLSDNAPPTIGGSGAIRSGKQGSKQGSRAVKGDDDIAMYTISDGRETYNTNIEAGSAQSLDSDASQSKLTTNITVQRSVTVQRH